MPPSNLPPGPVPESVYETAKRLVSNLPVKPADRRAVLDYAGMSRNARKVAIQIVINANKVGVARVCVD